MGGATGHVRPAPEGSEISIHAPRGGSDGKGHDIPHKWDDFNPRSPWGERLPLRTVEDWCAGFQSTLPVGGATYGAEPRVEITIFQSTLPVGGATAAEQTRQQEQGISIHAPRGGSDVSFALGLLTARISIHAPRGGSDIGWFYRNKIGVISIHAPRGGSDIDICVFRIHLHDFNPRSPWGERRHDGAVLSSIQRFQSTLPVGGATGSNK